MGGHGREFHRSPSHQDRGIRSELYATTGARQAGYASIGGKGHAGVWSGTAESFVDLQALLPATYTESYAQGIWSDGVTTLVVGGAYNTTTNHYEAVLWKQTPAPPAVKPVVKVSGAKKVITAKAKLTIKGKATGQVTSVTAHGPGGDSAPVKVTIIRK